jgi:hypothetical protein
MSCVCVGRSMMLLSADDVLLVSSAAFIKH